MFAAFALLQRRRRGDRSSADAAAPSAKVRRRAQRAALRAAQRSTQQQRAHAFEDGAPPDLLVTFTLTPRRGGAASGESGLLAERRRTSSHSSGEGGIFAVAPPLGDGERAAPRVDARADAIDALLRDACAVPSGWTSEPRLTETLPLGAIDRNAVRVARRALHELWERRAEEEEEEEEEEDASGAAQGGDAAASAPLGWGELDGTLLTQYVRGYRHDDVDEWCDELTDKLQRGLLLRGRGEVDLDGVALNLFAAAAVAAAAATADGPWGANTSALPWSRRELLRRRVPGDGAVHSAFPSFVYGESDRGHVIHGERTSAVDFSALLRLPLDQVALVRLQLCETLGELKRRASARLQKRIFKHIVLLDLYNMPLTKLTISAAARKIVGQILEVQSMCVCIDPSARARLSRSRSMRCLLPLSGVLPILPLLLRLVLRSQALSLSLPRMLSHTRAGSFNSSHESHRKPLTPPPHTVNKTIGTRKARTKCGSSTPHRSSSARTRC